MTYRGRDPGERAEHEVATAGVPHDPRRHVDSPNVDDGREHRLHEHRAQSLAVVDAILQTQDSGIGAKVRPQRVRGCLGVGRLDAEEHYVGITRGLRVGGRGNPDGLAAIRPFDDQPIACDRIRLRRPPNQCDRGTGPGEHAVVEAAHGAGAQYRNARPTGMILHATLV